MYFTNAIKPWDIRKTDLFEELCHEVLPDIVIALGQIASKKLWDAGVSHFAIPHPSYWRRFHGGDFPTYVKMLKEIVSEPAP